MKRFSSELASEIIDDLRDGLRKEKNVRRLFLLEGPMGVGKTQFVRFLVSDLGSTETASPSFALHHSYKGSGELKIEHFDLFRLENADDLESIGFWDFFSSRNSVVIIEWSDRLKEFGMDQMLPLRSAWPRVSIKFELGSEEARTLKIVF